MVAPAPDSADTPSGDRDTPSSPESGAAATAPKPIGRLHFVVLIVFTIGVLAIPVVVVLGMLLNFDALGAVIWLAVSCVALSFVWSFGRDSGAWIGATARLARTGRLVPTLTGTPHPPLEQQPGAPVLTVADDDTRLDRRRVTRIVAEAQRKDPKLKQRRPPE